MNKHDKISRLLAAFALGELTPEEQAEVKAHLARCNKCGSELKRLQTLLECTGRLKELSPDARMCESAKQAVFTAVENEKNLHSFRPNASLESIRRTIMNGKIIKFAAAAANFIILPFIIVLRMDSRLAFGLKECRFFSFSTAVKTACLADSHIRASGESSFKRPVHSSSVWSRFSSLPHLLHLAKCAFTSACSSGVNSPRAKAANNLLILSCLFIIILCHSLR